MSDGVLKGGQDFLATTPFSCEQTGLGCLLPAIGADLQPPIQNRAVNP